MIRSKKLPKTNTSGYKGVGWVKKSKKWEAKLEFKGVIHRLGLFANIEDAIAARKAAEEKYYTPIIEKYGSNNKEQRE